MFVRAINEQAAAQGFGDDRRAVDREINAKDQAFAADFADEIELGGELFDSVAQLGTAFANVREQIGVFDDVQEFQRGGADERATAECGAVQSGNECRCKFFVGDDGAERQASGERFRYRENVRTRGEFLVSEVAAGASETALNLIGDQRGVVLRCKGAGALPERFADGENAAFTLNCFEHQCADSVVEFCFEISDVIEAHEFDAGNQRREWLAILCGMRDGERAERAAVEGIFQREDARFRRGAAGGRFA